MTTDDRGFLTERFNSVDQRITELRGDFHQHRIETRESIAEMRMAVAASNSRVDTLTHWMLTSLLTALLAAVGAVMSLFQSHNK